MSPSDLSEFDARWQELRARFIERLVRRMAAIRESWAVMQTGGDASGAARSTLFHEIHSLSGSGATFGYTALSDVARALEPHVDPRRPSGPGMGDTPDAPEIARLIGLIEVEVRRINPSA
jgi:hypothetical protein